MTTTFERPTDGRDDGYLTTGNGSAWRRKLRRPRVIAMLVALAAAALAAFAIWLLAFSSVFGVGTVDVRGTHSITSAQVRQAARVPAGAPLLRLDTDAIRKRVQRLPAVASARVDTSFPSTVTITVAERTPVGYVRTHGDADLVDRTGKRYRVVSRAPAGLPRLVLPHGAHTASTARAVASVAAALPASLRAQVDSVQALSAQSITVVLTHGEVVQWGSATRNADKARVLPVLLRRSDMHIDVTDPDQPFTR